MIDALPQRFEPFQFRHQEDRRAGLENDNMLSNDVTPSSETKPVPSDYSDWGSYFEEMDRMKAAEETQKALASFKDSPAS